jgi:Mg2+/Co2+ transporter CorB
MPGALALSRLWRLIKALLRRVRRRVQRLIAPARQRVKFRSIREIRRALARRAREGTVVKDERDMLGSILELDEVEVSEVMRHRGVVEMIRIGDPPARIVEQVLASPYSRFPVHRGRRDNVVGVLHVKDLLRAVRREGGAQGLNVEHVLSPPWFVPETTTLKAQLDAFLRKRQQFALVVDEYGALMGIVTLEDILEEIVGDILDEHDVAMPGVRPQPNGSYLVDGTVTIRDLNRQFDWRLPDVEATTVAGLVIHEARVIPEPGQKFAFHGFRFEVLRRHRNQITALRLTPPARLPAAS